MSFFGRGGGGSYCQLTPEGRLRSATGKSTTSAMEPQHPGWGLPGWRYCVHVVPCHCWEMLTLSPPPLEGTNGTFLGSALSLILSLIFTFPFSVINPECECSSSQ